MRNLLLMVSVPVVLLFVQDWLAPNEIPIELLKVSAPSVAATLMPPEPSVNVGLPVPANVKLPGSVLKLMPAAEIGPDSVIVPPVPPA